MAGAVDCGIESSRVRMVEMIADQAFSTSVRFRSCPSN